MTQKLLHGSISHSSLIGAQEKRTRGTCWVTCRQLPDWTVATRQRGRSVSSSPLALGRDFMDPVHFKNFLSLVSCVHFLHFLSVSLSFLR